MTEDEANTDEADHGASEPSDHDRPATAGPSRRGGASGGSPRARQAVIVAVVAVLAFAGALFLATGDDDSSSEDPSATGSTDTDGAAGQVQVTGACGTSDPVEVGETSYEIAFTPTPDPPDPQATVFTVSVDRQGQPVSGARVCMSTDMTEMSHPPANGEAEEVAPGQYDVELNFGMRGTWEGSIVVAEPGQQDVFMPVTVDVR